MNVDVVVPTIGRESLRRAVESVNSQSVPCRAIVVLDRPDKRHDVDTLLAGCDYQLLLTAGGSKSASARNLGLDAATSEYVAFLDDDDWWGPSRIKSLLEVVPKRTGAFVVASPLEFCLPTGERRIIPTSAPPFSSARDTGLDISALGNYLVSRCDLRFGRNVMQTSTLLMSREIAQRIRWDPYLSKHQDWDFILRLAQDKDIQFYWASNSDCFVSKGSPDSISRNFNWKASMTWLQRHDKHLNSRCRSDFLYVHVLRAALANASSEGLRAFISARPGRPHLAAVVVGLEGFRSLFRGSR